MEITPKGELALVVDGAFAGFQDCQQLAFFLADLGIGGATSHSMSCPLAIVLTSMMDGRQVRVDSEYAMLDDSDWSADAVPLPEVARTFVMAFDEGEFPYLTRDDDEDTDEDE